MCCHMCVDMHFLGNPAKDVLKKGLLDLTAVCEHILATFEVRTQYLFFFLKICKCIKLIMVLGGRQSLVIIT